MEIYLLALSLLLVLVATSMPSKRKCPYCESPDLFLHPTSEKLYYCFNCGKFHVPKN